MSKLTIHVRTAKTSELVALLINGDALLDAMSPYVIDLPSDEGNREIADAIAEIMAEIDRRVPVPG